MILIVFHKNVLGGKWTILGPKILHPHNSGSVVRIFLNFCIMERANRYMKVIIMVSTKKNLFRTNGLFWAQKWHILITMNWL